MHRCMGMAGGMAGAAVHGSWPGECASFMQPACLCIGDSRQECLRAELCIPVFHGNTCCLSGLCDPSQVDMLRAGMFGSLDEFGLRYCDGRPALDAWQATAPSRLDLRCARPPACAVLRYLHASGTLDRCLLSNRTTVAAKLPWRRGSSNLDELHWRLEQALMIRRLKKDVNALPWQPLR